MEEVVNTPVKVSKRVAKKSKAPRKGRKEERQVELLDEQPVELQEELQEAQQEGLQEEHQEERRVVRQEERHDHGRHLVEMDEIRHNLQAFLEEFFYQLQDLREEVREEVRAVARKVEAQPEEDVWKDRAFRNKRNEREFATIQSMGRECALALAHPDIPAEVKRRLETISQLAKARAGLVLVADKESWAVAANLQPKEDPLLAMYSEEEIARSRKRAREFFTPEPATKRRATSHRQPFRSPAPSRFGSGACFKCGQRGHFARNCPNQGTRAPTAE